MMPIENPAAITGTGDKLLSGLFFFHNPKAGGTAVQQSLERFFSRDQRCPLIENSQRDHERRRGRYSEFGGYAFYGGHYGYDIFSAVAPSHHAITCFREPISRLLSLYRYFRYSVPVPPDVVERDNLYPVLAAKHMSFRDFVMSGDPRIEVHTRNHHVRQLTSSAWDLASIGDLAHAIGLLAGMPWFYVAEHASLCQDWASAVFAPHPVVIGRANVTQTAGEIMDPVDADVRRCMHEKNELDYSLYNAAIVRLDRWCRHLAVPARSAQGAGPD